MDKKVREKKEVIPPTFFIPPTIEAILCLPITWILLPTIAFCSNVVDNYAPVGIRTTLLENQVVLTKLVTLK